MHTFELFGIVLTSLNEALEAQVAMGKFWAFSLDIFDMKSGAKSQSVQLKNDIDMFQEAQRIVVTTVFLL